MWIGVSVSATASTAVACYKCQGNYPHLWEKTLDGEFTIILFRLKKIVNKNSQEFSFFVAIAKLVIREIIPN